MNSYYANIMTAVAFCVVGSNSGSPRLSLWGELLLYSVPSPGPRPAIKL